MILPFVKRNYSLSCLDIDETTNTILLSRHQIDDNNLKNRQLDSLG